MLRLGAAAGAECVVCLDTLRPADRVRVLPCIHVFHEHCVDRWLRRSRTCPSCKQDVIAAHDCRRPGGAG